MKYLYPINCLLTLSLTIGLDASKREANINRLGAAHTHIEHKFQLKLEIKYNAHILLLLYANESKTKVRRLMICSKVCLVYNG